MYEIMHLSAGDPIESESAVNSKNQGFGVHQRHNVDGMPLPDSAQNQIGSTKCNASNQNTELPHLESSPEGLRHRSGQDPPLARADVALAHTSDRPAKEHMEFEEGHGQDEMQYPTGARLAVVTLSLGLALLLFGLVSQL